MIEICQFNKHEFTRFSGCIWSFQLSASTILFTTLYIKKLPRGGWKVPFKNTHKNPVSVARVIFPVDQNARCCLYPLSLVLRLCPGYIKIPNYATYCLCLFFIIFTTQCRLGRKERLHAPTKWPFVTMLHINYTILV